MIEQVLKCRGLLANELAEKLTLAKVEISVSIKRGTPYNVTITCSSAMKLSSVWKSSLKT